MRLTATIEENEYGDRHYRLPATLVAVGKSIFRTGSDEMAALELSRRFTLDEILIIARIAGNVGF